MKKDRSNQHGTPMSMPQIYHMFSVGVKLENILFRPIVYFFADVTQEAEMMQYPIFK
jgi:hypothetical protein